MSHFLRPRLSATESMCRYCAEQIQLFLQIGSVSEEICILFVYTINLCECHNLMYVERFLTKCSGRSLCLSSHTTICFVSLPVG